MIAQQIVAAKTLDNSVQKITVILRGADLLWPYQREKSRVAFLDAFEFAKQNYKAEGDAPKRSGKGLLVQTPDQRFVVIKAIAKRDPSWARKLTDELLNEEIDANKNSPASKNSPFSEEPANVLTAEKLLDTATSLLAQSVPAAMEFAGASLRYPASYYLTAFLYKLSEVDQFGADEFYRRALATYRDRPLREFLFLAFYPFGLDTTGDLPVTGNYVVPGNFSRNPGLQSQFAQTLLFRARRVMENGVGEQDNYNGLSGAGHVAEAITLIEPELRKRFPELATQLIQTRGELLTSLPADVQENIARGDHTDDQSRQQSFDDRLEAIEKGQDNDRRDQQLTMLVLNAGADESLDKVLKAAEKISDGDLRTQVFDWFYFNRAKRALDDKRFDEAAKLAGNVQELDQRAYLYSQIAKSLAVKPESQTIARELLERIIGTAEKAPNTIVTARAFLAAANLYLRFDPDRAVAVLAQAIKIINQLENPDFSQEFFFRRIEGRNFATYAAYKMPGTNPDTAFRDLAKIDFDSAIVQSTQFNDKPLRAQIALGLADFCLTRH